MIIKKYPKSTQYPHIVHQVRKVNEIEPLHKGGVVKVQKRVSDLFSNNSIFRYVTRRVEIFQMGGDP